MIIKAICSLWIKCVSLGWRIRQKTIIQEINKRKIVYRKNLWTIE
jgi:hypothetical protein